MSFTTGHMIVHIDQDLSIKSQGDNNMDYKKIEIEQLIPHRDRMKLIDRIIYIDEKTAATGSSVTDKWPTCKEGSIHPLLTIELIAQTVAVAAGWKKFQKTNEGEKGWLIGVKKSDFFVNKIPVAADLITEIEELHFHDYYGTFRGTVSMDEKKIASAEIQVFRAVDDKNNMF